MTRVTRPEKSRHDAAAARRGWLAAGSKDTISAIKEDDQKAFTVDMRGMRPIFQTLTFAHLVHIGKGGKKLLGVDSDLSPVSAAPSNDENARIPRRYFASDTSQTPPADIKSEHRKSRG